MIATSPSPSSVTERDLVLSCLNILRDRGVFAWRQNCGAFKVGRGAQRRVVRATNVNGVSDIIGVLPGGRMLAVEVKRQGNVPSDDQQAFLDPVNRRGGLGLLVYDVQDLTEIVERELLDPGPSVALEEEGA